MDTEINLIGALKIMEELNIKPNFSELQKQFGIDRIGGCRQILGFNN